ncbi:MAG: hypothetical protein KJ626_03140 [Verrucomicrobia bacterium]|nr:hypothetical protein [Verrucomicrobiota bacterium]
MKTSSLHAVNVYVDTSVILRVLFRLTESLLESVEGSFPREKIDVFLTHDKQLGAAARSLGFAVKGTKSQPSR